MVTLAFLDPGHFHAALTLRVRNARIADDVHLYAPPGPERDAFLALVDAFNRRAEEPTAWRVAVHEGTQPLARLVDDGHADAVVIAGRNAGKLEAIAALHAAGLPVLADKPWLTHAGAVADLEAATDGPPLAMDIMTERFDRLARLRHRLVNEPEVFGAFRNGDEEGPAIDIGSTHHLYKIVNGASLRRPAWYYDTGVQGSGVVDIQSHMVDQAQWLAAPDAVLDPDRDVDLTAVRTWTTPVPLDLFTESTGLDRFPESLADRVSEGELALDCNAIIEYSIRGVTVRQRAQWGQREPAGGGDIQSAVLRGERADIVLEHGPETGFVGHLHVRPRPGEDVGPALREVVSRWQDELPGLGVCASPLGLRLDVPPALRSTHESHFAMAMDRFLDHLEAGAWPADLQPRIRTRYALLAKATLAAGG